MRSALLLACVLAAVVSADRAGIMTCLMNKLRRLSPEAKSDVGCGSNSTDKNLKLELMKNQSKDNFTTAAPGSTCQERGLQEDVDGQCCQAVHMDFKGHCCMVGTLDKNSECCLGALDKDQMCCRVDVFDQNRACCPTGFKDVQGACCGTVVDIDGVCCPTTKKDDRHKCASNSTATAGNSTAAV